MGRTSYDVADIVRLHRIELETVQPLDPVQGRALSAIALCRTSALGGFVLKCPNGDWSAEPIQVPEKDRSALDLTGRTTRKGARFHHCSH